MRSVADNNTFKDPSVLVVVLVVLPEEEGNADDVGCRTKYHSFLRRRRCNLTQAANGGFSGYRVGM
jgi:hypothetical protein